MSRWPCLLIGVLTLTLAVGCSRTSRPERPGDEDSKPQGDNPKKKKDKPRPHTVKKPNLKDSGKPKPPPNPAVTATEDAGVISGRVRGRGEKGPGIAGAVVWLENAPADQDGGSPEDQVLSQKDGKFHPHLLLARQGTRLKLVSADPQADFRATDDTGALIFDVSLSQGKREFKALRRAGRIEVRSEDHPKAVAYIWVFDHKYYTETKADGRFRLPAVPAGTYRLAVWHEGKGGSSAKAVRKRVTVTVGKDEGKHVEWALSEDGGAGK
jgi:hypothetical protein